jgi:hypothetical protein
MSVEAVKSELYYNQRCNDCQFAATAASAYSNMRCHNTCKERPQQASSNSGANAASGSGTSGQTAAIINMHCHKL